MPKDLKSNAPPIDEMMMSGREEGLGEEVRADTREETEWALPVMMCRLGGRVGGSGPRERRLVSLDGVRTRQMQVWFAARERRRAERATPPVAPRKRIVLGDMVMVL